MSIKALDELSKSVCNEGNEKYPENLFKRLRSLINLLTSNKELYSSALTECNEIFSGHMVTLYELRPAAALKFSLSIIMKVFKGRLAPILKLESTKDSLKAVKINEEVLRMVFNGIQNYLECDKPDSEQVGSALYKPVLGMLGSTLGLKLSARIRSQAYGLISDTAEGSGPNKLLLKDKAILGGSRLGRTMASTNDYLVLDTLLQLLARITPSAQDASGRKELAKEVFQSAKMLKAFGKPACKELSLLLENATGDQWEMTSDRIIATLAKVDSQKPQPFVLTCQEIHANSNTFRHPKPLDKIYMDSEGFIVNIQEEDAVDCLEVNYRSVTSIQLQERPQGSLSVTLSLSSPPMKGFEAVMSTSGLHTVAFTILSSQAADFKQFLQNRKLGAVIEHKPMAVSETKFSLADPLNVNGSYTLKGKSQELEKFYASSVVQSPGLSLDGHVVHKDVASTLGNIDKADITPEEEPPQERPEFVSSKRLENEDRSRKLRMKKVTESKLPVLKNQVTILNGNLSDLECLLSKDFMTPRKTSGPEHISFTNGQTRGEHEIARSTGILVPVIRPVAENKTPLSERDTSSATLKRKRDRIDVDGSDESDINIYKATKSRVPYNSQLLRPLETAAARSTTKYKSRARKSSPPLSPGINFDELPVRASPKAIHQPKLGLHDKLPSRPGKEEPIVLKSEVISASPQANPVKSNKRTKKECKIVSEEETVPSRRTRRVTKRDKVIESDENQEDDHAHVPSAGAKAEVSVVPITKDLFAMRPSTPVLLSTHQQVIEHPTKSKRMPWKNNQSAVYANNAAGENIIGVDIISSNKAKPNPPKSKLKGKETEKPKRMENLPVTKNNIPPSIAADPILKTIQSISAHSSSLTLPQSAIALEPLELDIAIAQAESFCMDVDDYNDSAGILITTSNDAIEERNRRDEASVAELDIQQTRIGREDHRMSALKVVTRTDLPFSVRSSSPPATSVPPRSILRKPVQTIDLTHLNNSKTTSSEGKQSNVDILEVDDLPDEEPVDVSKQPSVPVPKSSSNEQRLGVTFAADTKKAWSLSGSPSPHRIDLKAMKRVSNIPSRLPRLVVKREAKEIMLATPSKMKKIQKFEVPRGLRKTHSFAPQKVMKSACDTADCESDEDEIERELSPDEKIVNVLNDIQGVILDNLSRKFNIATTNTRNAVHGLRSFAAEEIHKMLEDSIKHRKNLVHLEEQYGHYSRELQQGFDEIATVNEDIDKRFRQAIVDHDQKGLMRIMPKKLAERPKIIQNLAASSSA
ncbi:hypothetical protein BU17DRAFT_96717 [Hysterangium stoloniferum]|nr:hypothetical protein BU17DRAFT_96717 [Hysterangium stoloniferum]